ncbi:MAG: serine/threonine-protein kinase [Planctomycetota bacterium]
MKDSETNLDVLLKIDAICNEFEQAARRDDAPSVSDYLDRVDDANREKLLAALIPLDLEFSGRRGRSTEDELVSHYAEMLRGEVDLTSLRSSIQEALRSTGPDTTKSWTPGVSDLDTTFDSGIQLGKLDDSLANLKVDGFEIDGVLGRGGMGVVYRAKQSSLGRQVALKMILNPAASAESLERFEREARAVAELNDPRFVQIHEFGIQSERPFMALELVEGGSLEAARRGEPLPERRAAELVEDVARAMQKAHDIGLVHRDLKPHNLLLDAEGRPKIADFGLVKRLDQSDSERTEDGRVMGTVSYMSPEQSRGEPDIGPASDIHALGAILYCLLTGRPPYLGATRHDTIDQVRNHEPIVPSQLRPGISRDLETVCLKCLQKEPSKRYATATDLADDLKRWLEGHPIIARPIGSFERSYRWVKRNPLGAAVIGLAAAIAIVTTTLSVMLRDSNQRLAVEKEGTEKALQQLQIETENAIDARKRKRDVYHEALASFYQVVSTIDTALRDTGQSPKLRKAILERSMQAVDQLEEFADEPVIDTLSNRNRAIGSQRVGDLLFLTGDLKRAKEKFEEVYQESLAAKQSEPETPRHYRNLANACRSQARVLARMGKTVEARQKNQEALELRMQWDEKAIASGKDNPSPKVAIAISHTELGGNDLSLGDAASAIDHFMQARKWRAKLSEDWHLQLDVPANKQLQELQKETESRVRATQMLAEANHQLGNHDAATELMREVVGHYVRLFKARQTATLLAGLSRSRLKLGDFHLIAGELSDAAPLYQGAAAGAEWLKKTRESKAEAERNRKTESELSSMAEVANVEYRLGELLRRAAEEGVELDEFVVSEEGSKKHFERSCELREELAAIDPQDMQAKIEWAVALARCGRVSKAEEQANILIEKGKGNPRLLFQAACTLALCSDAENPETAKRCKDAAYTVLQQLLEAGWRDKVALRDDPDLAPLRGEDKFEEILASVAEL